jgi:hypothetical protein
MFKYISFQLSDQPQPFTQLLQFSPRNPSFTTKNSPYEQTMATETQGKFSTMKELMQCQPKNKAVSQTVIPHLEIPHWTTDLVQQKWKNSKLGIKLDHPNKFTCNKGTKHAKILCLPGYWKILVHHNNIKPVPDPTQDPTPMANSTDTPFQNTQSRKK